MVLNLKDYLTVPEAAKGLRVNEETVRRHVRSGRLKAEKIGNQWFIHRDELSSFMLAYRSQQVRET